MFKPKSKLKVSYRRNEANYSENQNDYKSNQQKIDEILDNKQWKMIIDGEVVCIWATTFSDPLIWEKKDIDPSVYIHRITTNPKFRGKGLVKKIVEWSKIYATENGKSFVRMDTVGENHKLIEHYTACGFDFLGLSQLTNTDELPDHYHNAVVSLFELKV